MHRKTFGFLLGLCLLSVAFRDLSAAALTPTSTSLMVSSSSVAAATPITLTAHVSSATGPIQQGLVLFCNADAAHCTDINVVGQAQIKPNGDATVKLTFPIGQHTLKAVFVGTTLAASSTSAAASVTVSGKFSTMTSINASGVPGAYNLTGSVFSFGSPLLTGNVSFRDLDAGNQVVAQAAINQRTLQFLPTAATSSATLRTGATGDFDGDGKLDQAAFDQDGNLIIRLGKGDGTFTSGIPYAMGSLFGPILVGDFNGDDVLDLVVTAKDNNGVIVLLGKGDGLFTAQPEISTGRSPLAAATADLNNDGVPDLIIINQGVDISVYLGNGDGTFKSPVPVADTYASAVATADVNGDGRIDIVAINYSSTPLIFLNNGDGSFTAGPSIPPVCISGGCSALAMADFNGDGKLDLILADEGELDQRSGSVYILLANNGGFGPATPTGDSGFPFSLYIGDFNGDGVADFAVTHVYTLTEFVLGNGDGTFAVDPYASNVSARATAGDFNADGATDLAFLSPAYTALSGWQSLGVANGISVNTGQGTRNIFAQYEGDALHLSSSSNTLPLQGSKSQTTTALMISQTQVSRGEVVQLTATILPSVAGGSAATGNVSFFTGTTSLGSAAIANGKATLKTSDLPVGKQLLTASYSGDALFGSSTSSTVNLDVLNFRSQTTKTFLSLADSRHLHAGAPVTLSARVTSPADRVKVGEVIFFADHHPSFPFHRHDRDRNRRDHCEDGIVIGQAQLNAEGEAKLVWRPSPGRASVRAVFQAAGSFAGSESRSETLTAHDSIPTTTTISATAGKLESTVSASGEPAPSGLVFFVDKGHAIGAAPLKQHSSTLNLVSQPSLSPLKAPVASVVGDLNGDGFPDIVTTGDSGVVSVFIGTGLGTFVAGEKLQVDGFSSAIAIADLNSDGSLDLVVASDGQGGQSNGHVSIFLGKGDGTFLLSSSPEVAVIPQAIAISDLNGDGVPDIAVGNLSSADFVGTLTVLLGNGDGTFVTKTSVELPQGGPGSLSIADLNRDGIPDIVFPSFTSQSVSVMLGRGDGTFSDASFFPIGSYSYSAQIGDFNGDGIPDIAATGAVVDARGAFVSGEVTILQGEGNGTFAQQSSLTVGTDYFPNSLVVGDFNADGIPDIVASTVAETKGTGQLAVFFGTGKGNFSTSFYKGSGFPMVAADIDVDGVPDLVLVDNAGVTVGIQLSKVTTTSTAVTKEEWVRGGRKMQVSAKYLGDEFHASSKSAAITVESTQ